MSDCFDHAADAYDDLCFGRTADEGFSAYGRYSHQNWEPPGRTCKFCGANYLHWYNVGGVWRLGSKGKIHNCRAAAASADDFEVLP